MTIKKLGKSVISRLLESQVKQLRRKNDFTVIAVAGSVGKTTTKLAIASILEPEVKVRYQTGNYNDRLTVPLVFFGHTEPGIYNVAAWFKIWSQNRRALKRPFPYQAVIVELGSDGPGQMKDFAYIKPDIMVVTALTDEHMEYFKTLDAVAEEELTGLSFSKQSLVNVDDSDAKYLLGKQFLGYGTTATDYRIVDRQPATNGQQHLSCQLSDVDLPLTTSLLGLQGAKSVIAAAAAAHLFGLTPEQIAANVSHITAVAGRMRLLSGKDDINIIDDTYNASPVAMRAALDELYTMTASQKIALLGNMNEMGALSQQMHTDVGNYCEPDRLDLVVTLGTDANAYLAPAAEARGCTVQRFTDPYAAGEFIQSQANAGAAILFKGSQNGVYAEEAIKPLLKDQADESKLVRQSAAWLQKKRAQFSR